MPSKKRPSSAAADYSSDGGFVADAPNKRARAGKDKSAGGKDKRAGGEEKSAGGKKGEKEIAGGGFVGKEGVFWELSGKRRVGIQEWKGKPMMTIREFYEKDGEMLPGKKGISLPIEQVNAFVKLLPHIETVLIEKGQSIERPDYGGAGAKAVAGLKEEEGEEEVKKNFEQTSDEDD